MNGQKIIEMVEQEWRDRLEAAVKAEREACAKVCEAYQDPFAGNAMADAIRARGEA
jgi:hypothetical protein